MKMPWVKFSCWILRNLKIYMDLIKLWYRVARSPWLINPIYVFGGTRNKRNNCWKQLELVVFIVRTLVLKAWMAESMSAVGTRISNLSITLLNYN